MTANERLRDVIVRRAVLRSRSTVREHVAHVVTLWRELGRTIHGMVREVPGIVTTEDARDLLDRIPSMTAQAAGTISAYVSAALGNFVAREAGELPAVIERAMGSAPVVPFQTSYVLDLSNSLVSPLGEHAAVRFASDLRDDVIRGIRNVLIGAVARRQSSAIAASMIRTVVGNKRWSLERFLRSEFVRVANHVALLTYRRNARQVRGTQWTAIVSRTTCLACGALHGRFWTDMSAAKLPVTSTHMGCQCLLLPVLKAADDLGLPDDAETRRNFDGKPAGVSTYAAWFAGQDEAFQRDVLGPVRLALYKRNNAVLSDFVVRDAVRRVRDVQARMLRRSGTP